jgi:long-chain fatty acid transport protein
MIGAVRIAASAAVLALAASPAVASPLELFGFGGRSPGLGGAGVAAAEGFESVYLNPAGLAATAGKRLTLGTAATAFDLTVDGADAGVEDGTAFVFGGALPIPLGGALADRVGLGLGFHVPNQALVRVDRPLVGEPTFAVLGNRADSIGIQLAAGVRISDRLAVGAGFLALAALRGTIVVTNDAAGAFITSSEQRLATHFAPIAGAHYQLSPQLGLGLTLRGPSRSDYAIEVETDVTALPLSLPELAVAGNAQYDPPMATAGAAYRLAPWLLVLGEIEYRRWSGFPRPTENPVVGGEAPPAPGFRDTAVPRLAAEGRWRAGSARLTGRAGYAFFLSPAPEMTGEISLLDNHRHLLAAGGGLAFPGAAVPLHIDAWVQLHVLHDRRHEKDPDRFAPEEPPFAAVESGGSVLAGGLTVGVDL